MDSRPRTRRGSRLIARPTTLMIIGVTAAAAIACTGSEPPATPPPPTSPVTVAPSVSPPPAPAIPMEGLAASFAELQAALQGSVGLAAVPVDSPDASTYIVGDWSAGPAWSTSKVPLVMAAMREAPTAPATANMIAAITQSDNDAAETIWKGLGEPEGAAGKMTAVLSEAGDPTVVQSQRVRPEFTAFGQTIWSLDRQAQFLAHTACDAQSAEVLDLMAQITASQRWGLGAIPNARFKGGWGPSPAGDYLVRQFGLVHTNRGVVAIALAAAPSSGSLDSGIEMMNAMTGWLSEHLDEVPAGQCH